MSERKYLEWEFYTDLYPELLKRMDDSNDEVRVATCAAFQSFFRKLPANWNNNAYTYILTSLFVHFDDPNKNIREAVNSVLSVALNHLPDKFLTCAQKALNTSVQSVRQIESLIALAESVGADETF